MRSTFLAFCLLVTLTCLTSAAEPSKVLIGRWRAETVPTGYWIVDRYSDGRFAEKAFLISDYSKPAEVAVSWGRWKLRGKSYLTIFDGSTSPFVRRFAGKWKTTKVANIRAGRYDYYSQDGPARYELPYAGNQPLLEVALIVPEDLRGANCTILKPDWADVPQWVNSCPTP